MADSLQTGGSARRWLVLAVMCASVVLVSLEVTALNLAVPTLMRDLGASVTQTQWIVDAYILVFACLLMPMGALGDRFGRKGLFLAGTAVFAASLAGASAVDTPAGLIGARAVMGAGAAMMFPATLSIITTSFPAEQRNKAVALWAGFAGFGGAIGPIMGGWLLERYWWGSLFAVIVPIAVVAGLAAALVAPRSRDPQGTPLDPVGATLAACAVFGVVFALIEAPEHGWAGLRSIAGFAAAAAAAVVFVLWERRARHPMLDLSAFRDRRFTMGAVTVTVGFLAFIGLLFVLSQYLQFVRGYAPFLAGCSTLPMAVALLAAAPLSDVVSRRIGARAVVTGGLLLLAAGVLGLATADADTPYALLAVLFCAVGAGIAAAVAPATALIMESLPLAKAGVGSAVNDTTRELGAAVGVALVGSITSSAYRANMETVLSGLPPEAAEAALESIGGALAVAPTLPPEIAGPLAEAARASFGDAVGTGLVVVAVMAVFGAVAVAMFLPRARAAAAAEADGVDTRLTAVRT